MDIKNFTEAWFGDPAKWQARQSLSFSDLIEFIEHYDTAKLVETTEMLEKIKQDFEKKMDYDPAVCRITSVFVNEFKLRSK